MRKIAEKNNTDARRTNEGMNRRTAIKTVGGAIVFASTTAAADSVSSDDVEIPIVVSGDDVIESRKVSTSWWDAVKRARRIQSELSNELAAVSGVKSVGIALGSEKIGGRNAMAVEVERDTTQGDQGLPSRRDGIEIRISEKPIGRGGGCYNDYNFDNMHGGVRNEANLYGTSCCRDDNRGHMLTAAHLFDACDRGSAIDNDALDQSGRLAGYVDSYNIQEDWVACDDSSATIDYTNKIRNELSTHEVVGSVTNYEYIISEGTFVYQMGCSTGETVGQMEAYNVSANVASGDVADCVDLNGRGVRVDSTANYFGKGDSGGPMYIYTGGGVGLVGMGQIGYYPNGNHSCNGGSTVWTRCEGISSERLVEHGFVF